MASTTPSLKPSNYQLLKIVPRVLSGSIMSSDDPLLRVVQLASISGRFLCFRARGIVSVVSMPGELLPFSSPIAISK